MGRRTQKTPKLSASKSKSRQLAESDAQHERDAKVGLDHWNREFDAMYARMQSHAARRAIDALCSASDVELNRSKS
jgi:hypothetical protein